MEWKEKIRLVELANKARGENLLRASFHNYVLEKLPVFDEQSWEMFVDSVSILPSEMQLDAEFWKQVYPHIKLMEKNGSGFGFRSAFRVSLILKACEQYLLEDETHPTALR